MFEDTNNGITHFDPAAEAAAVEAPKKKRASPVKKQVIPESLEATVVEEKSIEQQLAESNRARKAALKDKWMREKARNSKLVTGKFLFNECPGGQLDFSFREFPGDPLVKYKMKHDSIHTIPLGVARHLNNRCSYPEYQHNLDNGKAIASAVTDGQQRIEMYIMSKVHRTSFIPLDFTEDAEYHNGKTVAEVTYTDQRDKRFNLDSLGR